MIDRIIEEINVCLNNNCFLVALSSALTLPDICGKVEYPDKGNKERYLLWYDNFIIKYEQQFEKNELPCINGEIVWALRNNALHQGTFDFNGYKFFLTDWELFIQKPNSCVLNGGYSLVETIPVYEKSSDNKMSDCDIDKNHKEKTIKRFLSISLLDLIYKICACAKVYYENNIGNFNFLKNKIVVIEKNAKEVFKIKNDSGYKETFKLDKKKDKFYF